MRQRCTLQDLNRARPASSSARPIRLASPLLSAVTAESTAKTEATKSNAVSDKLFIIFTRAAVSYQFKFDLKFNLLFCLGPANQLIPAFS